MSFSDLQRPAEDDAIDIREFRSMKTALENQIYPSDREYNNGVYFDSDRFAPGAEVDMIVAGYSEQFPDLTFTHWFVTADFFADQRVITSKRAQNTFFRQGYVSTVEDRQVPVANKGDTKFAKAHKDILFAHGFTMAQILQLIGEEQLGIQYQDHAHPGGEASLICRHPLSPLVGRDSRLTEQQHGNARPDWQEAFEEEEGPAADWLGDRRYDRVWQEFKRQKLARYNYALVESHGLLLGRRLVNSDDRIHMAHEGTPGTHLKCGKEYINKLTWSRYRSEIITERLRAELDHGFTTEAFSGAHWEETVENQDTQVTPAMLAVWESQALASLRKIAWRVSAEESASALNNELLREKQALRAKNGRRKLPVGTSRMDNSTPEFSALKAVQTNEAGSYIDLMLQGRRKAHWTNAELGLSHRDLLIGAYYGMTYDETDLMTKPNETYEIAYWLGQLRRHGRATITNDFWSSIFDHVEHDSQRNLVISMLSEQAWDVLLIAARELSEQIAKGNFDTKRTIEVTYDWSSANEPWTASRNGDTIAIKGPLLFFPVHERDFWQEKAEFIQANGGFAAPMVR
ncbi:hypothetical protein [Pelagibacterium luteolum]|uniref:Uncharacterized protein n=1 Tax=Pelagibacterium luteolum TaxID=440168 RepID=A0A1G7ZUK3_9HYPH|nr:hypothetical protein [Pelagibacterium luteolum]SDH11830.1 hypothetical protein SAMN04487974_12244 [Pelagibacterium luteolum]